MLEAESTDDLAALVVEPYEGVGGIIFPPTGYLPRLQEWAAKRNIIFILDEVQSCFGRTGKWFALEWETLRPGMVCLGKGTGRRDLDCRAHGGEPIHFSLSPGELGGGNGGNPFACTSALTVIEIIAQEKLNEHAVEIGGYLLERMHKWQDEFQIIGDVRGQGLCLAMEFVQDRETKEPLRGFSARVERGMLPQRSLTLRRRSHSEPAPSIGHYPGASRARGERHRRNASRIGGKLTRDGHCRRAYASGS